MQNKNILEYWYQPKKTELEQMNYTQLLAREKRLLELKEKNKYAYSVTIAFDYELEKINYLKYERGL